ncbi:MAG: purine-nucleoside phosphorylase [Thermoguttaceae bacterium]|nr:purine-nucleoside phosphorylase [Thermoguttaceae bacterium]
MRNAVLYAALFACAFLFYPAQAPSRADDPQSASVEKSEYDRIQDAVAFIRTKWDKTPSIGIVLGTGLGALADQIDADVTIPYGEIPHFATSTVKSHSGELILGTLEGKTVVAMKGRLHYYEGYSVKEITFPIRVMRELGIQTLIVSNACGGLNPQYQPGDIMIIEDHISFFMPNPLNGVNDERLGTGMDMLEPYSRDLIALARKVPLEDGVATQKGVYVAVPGPQFETRAEYRLLRGVGADVVGMSTVPEVMVAVHGGVKVLGFSVITDMGLPDSLEPCDLERVIKTANDAEPVLSKLVRDVVKAM